MKSNVPLASLTTFNIGGHARFFTEVRSVEDAVQALAFAKANSLPVFVLGGGSNVVIADDGFDGLTLLMRIGGISAETQGASVFVTVGSGVEWDEFVLWTIEKGFTGLECMSGVPGTVGGAVAANLGCYGAQVSDTFISAEVIDTKDASDKVQVVRKEECDFSYHDSVFGHMRGRYVIVRATFALSTDRSASPVYRDNRFDMATLAKTLGRAPTQREVRDSVLNMREEKGSLIMEGRISYKNAGSFFHMPFVSRSVYENVKKIARALDAAKEEKLRPWYWEQPNGLYKLASGFLLEYTEFQKGYVRGTVGISPRHSLSIINVADASAKDIACLARDMQKSVEKLFGICLEREVEYIGNVEC